MKAVQSSFIRALFSIVIGALLIKYREETVTWLTILIGALFFLSGLISCIMYYVAKRHDNDAIVYDANGQQISGFHPTFPLVGIGSMLLGIMLALMPNTFVAWLVYILATILILGAINQFFILASITRFIRVGFIFWFLPCVILLIGVIAVAKPAWIATAPLFILGWALVLYGIVECIDAFKVMAVNRKYKIKPVEKVDKPEKTTQEVIETKVETIDSPTDN